MSALTNEDFRKLLMTPRTGAPSVAPPSAKLSSHSSKSVPSSIHSHRSSRWNEDKLLFLTLENKGLILYAPIVISMKFLP